MADFNENSNNSPKNEWDIGWEEFWDLEAPDVNFENSSSDLELALNQAEQFSKEGRQNALEQALETDQEELFSLQKNWGIIDDLKPTNFAERIKNIVSNPFSAVLNPKQPRVEEAKQPSLSDKKPNIPTQSKAEDKKTIKEKISKTQVADKTEESTHLEFNNLNKVSRQELNEINKLLEGSLGKADKITFDKEVVQDKNIHFVTEEKANHRKQELAKIHEMEQEKVKKKAEKEQKIKKKSKTHVTIGMSDIRFDLQSASETAYIFSPDEIQATLTRIPEERDRLLKENSEQILDSTQTEDTRTIGDALFGGAGEATQEPLESTTENLLDNLLNEIDSELTSDKDILEPSDETIDESLAKDEIITEESIVDDNAEAALEFMDSAAMEAETLFEDFFKQGEAKEKKEDKKLGYLDLIKVKIKEARMTYELWKRFLKDPKYFLSYYRITVKDLYMFFGIIFTFISLLGVLHLQYITEGFPMNF